MMLKKLFYRYRLPLLLLGLLVVLGGCGGIDDEKTAKTLTTVAGVLVLIVQGIAFVAVALAAQLGKLMSSYYILDSGMGETLYNTWSVIRNFVNIAFVLLLLIIAVRVILGFGENSGLDTLKKMLPRFVLALIGVNLTFFGARVVLTASDVLTTAVYTIPRAVGGQNLIRSIPCDQAYWSDQDECLKQINGSFKTAYEDLQNPKGELGPAITTILAKGSGQMTLERVGTRTIPLAILVNFIDFSRVVQLSSIGTIGSFITKSIGVVFASGAIALSFVVLFVAFVVRMVMLWVMIVISPAAVLLLVLKDVIPVLGEGAGGLKTFVNYALMPVYTAVPLSLGMIMILANGGIRDYGTEVKLENFFSGDLNSLIWFVAAIVIIWVGTKKAIKQGGELAASVSGHVSGAIEGVAKNVVGAAQYIPFIPTGGGGKMSVGELTAIPQGVSSILSSAQSARVRNKSEAFASLLPKDWTERPAMTQGQAERAQNEAARGVNTKDGASKAILELARKFVDERSGKSAKDSNVTPEFVRMASFVGVDVRGMKLLDALEKILREAGNNLTAEQKSSLNDHIGMLKRQASGEPEEGATPPATAPTIPGITPSAPGAVTAAQASRATDPGIEINGQKLYEVKMGDQKVYFAPTDAAKPAEGGQIAFSENDLKEAIESLDNKNKDDEFIAFVKALPTQIIEKQKTAILAKFADRVTRGDVEASRVDDFERLFTQQLKITDSTEFNKLVKDKFKKDGNTWVKKT